MGAAHIWVKDTGKQLYLGGFAEEQHAAEAYDVAAIKCKGKRGKTNFPASKYANLTEFMKSVTLQELVMAVRRQSQGFARGSSSFRGVTHHPNGRWEARIGTPGLASPPSRGELGRELCDFLTRDAGGVTDSGSKHIYLGLFSVEADAACAYDRAMVRLRGANAATNFALSNYAEEMRHFNTEVRSQLPTAADDPTSDLASTSPGSVRSSPRVGASRTKGRP